jgi:hypothetical protein
VSDTQVVFDGGGITLYQGDVIQVLNEHWEQLWPVRTVLTVPPWVRFARAASLHDGRANWTAADEAEWLGDCVTHYTRWLPVVKHLVADSNGRVWLIVHMAYFGPCLRVAYMFNWPTPQVWTTPGSSLVVMLLGERVSRATRDAVQDALDTADDPMINVALHDAILSHSEGPVMDPFCGTGLTLERAHVHGQRAIGIEIGGAPCTKAIERLTRCVGVTA